MKHSAGFYKIHKSRRNLAVYINGGFNSAIYINGVSESAVYINGEGESAVYSNGGLLVRRLFKPRNYTNGLQHIHRKKYIHTPYIQTER